MSIRPPSSHKTVFNFLKQLRREIDAQELYLELQRQGKKIGLATVYRALKTLHEQGSIQERISIKGKSLYSATSFHQQHHLNCLHCQRSIVIDSCPINIPKGTTFIVAQYLIFRHPEFWDNPEQFNPDRFLPEKVMQRPKFAFFPFGAGQHICIGKNLALMESMIILAAIMQRFQIELVPNQSAEIDPRFSLRPKYGIRVRVHKRY